MSIGSSNAGIQICRCGAVYFKEGTPESIGKFYGYPVGHDCPLEKPNDQD